MKYLPKLWLLLLCLLLTLFFNFASAEFVAALDFSYMISDGTCSVTLYCGSDEEVTIPGTIEGFPVISVGGFAKYFKLRSVVLPQNLARIDKSAFKMCIGLETVLFQQGLTEICSEAFSNCEQLKSIELPEGLLRIGDRVFYGCKELDAIRIPASVVDIGEDAFSDCGSHLIAIVQPDSYALSYCEENQVPYAIDYRITPEPLVETAPDDSVETASDDSVETAPDFSIETVPDDSVETAPDDSVETAPDDSVETAPDDSVETAPTVSAMPVQPENRESWTCENGHEGNTRRFCTICGAPKHESIADSTWTCENGHEGNSDNFCPICGARKPDSIGKVDETSAHEEKTGESDQTDDAGTAIGKKRIKIYTQSGSSMEPAIAAGTKCQIELGTEISRGDIVCFESEGNPPAIKRVVAVPGDTVYRLNGVTHVILAETAEDIALDEYLAKYFSYGSPDDYEAYVLEEDEFFLVGDNVEASRDSRNWKDSSPEDDIGPIKRNQIIGKYIGPVANVGLFDVLSNMFS